ncbi:MAG: ABC transporter substrate-binding protein [Planctomycetota bacterium]|nr:MAG: ABC transporter substrate-binding protein [Planctomycetota bacterium]
MHGGNAAEDRIRKPAVARCLAAAWLLLALFATGCDRAATGGSAPTPFAIARNGTLNRIIERKKLIVGMEVEFWPFEYDDGHGNPVGFDVDLARELARALGVELEIRDIEWAGLIPSLLDGKVDLVISGMTATLERARTIAFSRPYFETGLCLLVRKDSRIEGPDDLDDPAITLALKTGTTGHLVAERRFPRARKRFFKDEAACALEVAQGKADAFVYDQVSVMRHAREHAGRVRAILTPFTYEPYAIGMRQGEVDLARYVDMFLARLEADGRLAALRRKHLGELGKRDGG